MNGAPLTIDALVAATDELFLEETGWLGDSSPEDLERTYADFSVRFHVWLGKLVERLGAPSVTRVSNPDLASELYFEAFELAAWPKGVGYMVLACGQHDRETPVFISVGYREADAT